MNATVHTTNIMVRYRVFSAAWADLKGVPDCLMYITKSEMVNQAVTTLIVEIIIILKALARESSELNTERHKKTMLRAITPMITMKPMI